MAEKRHFGHHIHPLHRPIYNPYYMGYPYYPPYYDPLNPFNLVVAGLNALMFRRRHR